MAGMADSRRRSSLDRLVGVMPVDAVVRQIDVEALVERVDVNAVLDRVDIDRLIERIDVNAVVARLDLGHAVAQSTRGVAARALDAFRVAGGRLDVLVETIVDRVLHRSRTELGPGLSTSPS